ncbi:MAG: heme o synthase [Pseudomonadota bacterium]
MQDYLALMKPRVMSLVLLTAAVGIVVAPIEMHPFVAFACLVCIAAGAAGSGALNMWWDADIDAKMARTQSRPVPAGRVEADTALALGLGLSILSVTMLAVFANPAAAALLAFTIFFYAVIYTVWLKRRTPQNIVIGGAAGAFPPMIGWLAATGGLAIEPLLLFGLIFLWTPPHFWALALFSNADYTRAGVPMLPVVVGERGTRRQILLYSLILAPVALAPAFTAIGGPVYLLTALYLNAGLLRGAWQIARRSPSVGAADTFKVEKRFFGFSIVYLFGHFVALVVDAFLRGVGLAPDAWLVLL